MDGFAGEIGGEVFIAESYDGEEQPFTAMLLDTASAGATLGAVDGDAARAGLQFEGF